MMDIAAQVRAGADETERRRRVPDALFSTLAEAGLFRMLVPRALGRAERDPRHLLDVVEEISAVDGSIGWLVNIGATSGVLAGYLGEDTAREVFGEPGSFVCFVSRASGHATAVDGGYRATGRWPFASGCLHATWLAATCAIRDGDTPRTGADGKPVTHVLFFPTGDCKIHDTWHVSGLCGTGSHDFSVEVVSTGGSSAAATRGEIRLAAAHAATEAARSVDIVHRLAGSTLIFATQPFERRFRDVHAATQNFTLSPDRYGAWGRVLLGMSPPEW